MTSSDLARQSRRRLDTKLAALQPAERFVAPPLGWIRAIRTALGMAQGDLALRLGVSAQAVQQFEASESDGSVRLSTLRRAAEAMDCTLVYALVPRSSLEETVEAQVRSVLAAETAAAERSMVLEAQGATLSPEALRPAADALIASRRLWRG